MRRVVDHIEDALSGGFLLFGLVIVTMEITGRGLFAASFIWSEEVSRYTLIWMTYFGVAAAVRADSHIKVTVFIERAPVALQRILATAACLVCMGFSIVVAWYGVRLVQDSRMFGLMSADSDIPIPIWVFQSVIPVAFSLIALRLAERIWVLWRPAPHAHGQET